MKSNLIQEKLNPGVIQIWISDLRDWKSNADDFKESLSREEIERYQRLIIPEKKDQFLFSRGLLRLILSSYLDLPADSIDISIDAGGKPFLQDSNLTFNVSHSGDFLLYGFCLGSSIGVDIQQIYSITNPDIIIKNTFSLEEKEYLENLPESTKMNTFFNIWTAKEAYLKALGDGFQEPPTGISTIPDPSSGEFTLIHPSRVGRDTTWTIQSVEIVPGYIAAFAVNGVLSKLDKIQFTPVDLGVF